MTKSRRLAIPLLALLAAPLPLPAASPFEAAPLKVGELSSVDRSSPHPYPAGDASRPVVARARVEHPGATYLVLHFARLDLAPGDELSVTDAQGGQAQVYTGRGFAGLGEFWTRSLRGDVAILELRAAGAGGGYGFDLDRIEHGFAPLFAESVCGADDKRAAACYETSHPRHFQSARAVAQLRHCGNLCSGSLISCQSDFMSNEHCKGGCGITNAEAWFNYQTPTCTGGATSEVSFQALAEVDIDDVLDYWVLRFAGDPQAQFGHLLLEPRPLVQDEVVFIGGHPGGRPKELSIASDRNAGNVCRIDAPSQAGNAPDSDAGYWCDTEGGSSGSPVLSDSSQNVIALHHFGFNCNQPNGGVRIENIAPRLEPLLVCAFCPALPAATGLTATPSGPNRVDVSWSPVAGAASYLVRRALGGCTSPGFVEVGRTAAPPFVDTGVSGGATYGYIVDALDATGCAASRSACVSATATGPCTLSPAFAGVQSVASAVAASCELRLGWSPATPACGGSVSYNVHRSTSAGFTPSPANRIASCVSGTTYVDAAVQPGTRYHYVVRAEDAGGSGGGACAGGAEDANLVERAGLATGGPPFASFADGAEGAPLVTLEAPWAASTASARTGSRSYRVPGTTTDLCASLVTPPLVVTATSRLTYSTRPDNIENDPPAWDGGTVELSTDLGRTWQPLTPTPPYPATFNAQSSACNNAGGNGCYSGNSASWTDASVALGAWAGQEVQVRFRFGTDGSVTSTAWFVDDVRVSDVSDAPCTGGPALPPGEVSALGDPFPLWLVKRPGGQVQAYFNERTEALGYNYYEGDIGTWFNHGASPFLCDPPVTTVLPGQLTLTYAPRGDDRYYLVTAWNGDPTDGEEGTSGTGRPPAENTCDPVNDN